MEQVAYWKEPESDPFTQVRDSDTHCEPYATLDDWYAVTDCPASTFDPFHTHAATEPVFVPALELLFVFVFVFVDASVGVLAIACVEVFCEHAEYWYEPES